MDRIKGLLRWLSSLFTGNRFESELTDEIELHVEMETAENIRRGMEPEEARRSALRDFGGVERTREQVRETGTVFQLENIIRDTRYALRTLALNPLFTMSLVLTLGTGIGCAMAMLGLVHSTLLKPLPFPDPHELVLGQTTFDSQPNPWSSGPDFLDYRDQCGGFESLSAIMPFPQTHTVTGTHGPERITGTAVSPGLFTTLGIRPIHGRVFSADEGSAGAPEVVIVSHEFWKDRFAGNTGAVGSVLTIDGVGRTIVGIMPADFEFSFMGDFDFWRPMRPDRDVADLRDRHNWLIIGRLADGRSLDQVQAQVDAVSARLAVDYPETNVIEGMTKGLLLVDLQEYFVQGYRTGLLVLLAATGLLLLIACANVTGLQVNRDFSRRGELAVRKSLGASRGRLLIQLLIERVLAAVAAGVLGVLLMLWLQPLILQFFPIEVPGVGVSAITLPLLFLSIVLSITAVLLTGIVPALRSTAGDSAVGIHSDGWAIIPGRSGFRRGLIFSQVALTVILLIGSGLLIRSLNSLLRVDPGFEPEDVLTAELELPPARYPERAARIGFYTDLLERIRSSPGIESAALINMLPIRDPFNWFQVFPEGEPDNGQQILLRSVSPDYFRTMQIPILRGRPVRTGDTLDTPRCVISRTLAERLFPDTDPVGRQVSVDYFGQQSNVEVVGIAGDVLIEGLSAGPGAILYAAYPALAYYRMTAVIKASGDASSAAAALKEATWSLDSDIPVTRLAMMEDLISESVSERRTMTVVLTLYAIIPLFLAAVGLYGLLAFVVRQRFREIGVRVALGAAPGTVVSLILRQGLGLVGLGLAVGFAGALGATRLIRHHLFGVEPTDPVTFIAVGLGVTIVALIACLLPTRQALRVDPITALRVE